MAVPLSTRSTYPTLGQPVIYFVFGVFLVFMVIFAANPYRCVGTSHKDKDKERGDEEYFRLLLSSRLFEYALQFQVFW